LYLTLEKKLWVLDGFLSILKKFEKNKIYNMLSLMLDPNLKFSLVSYVIDLKQGVSIAKEYDKQFFFPMLLKCHQILHIMAKFGFVANNILMKIPILTFLKCMLG